MKQRNLWEFETGLHSDGLTLICGVDEAGRGPLAGPVCAAAVILPEFDGTESENPLNGLDDSKKLTERKREELFPQIQAFAVAWSVAWASVEEIERLNILQATLLAMNRAMAGLSVRPEIALIDGNRSPETDIPVRTVVHGDSSCACIAAASVLAKVSRDRLMCRLSEQYPMYGFDRHKGYGTAAHYEAIRRYGPCPIHRMSFLKNL